MAKAEAKKLMFAWEGTDKRGARLRGETRAVSVALAKAELRRQGINPVKVNKKSQPLFGKRKKKIKAADVAIFSRQIATMMSSGVPLVQSFDIIGKGHENPAVAELIMAIKADVESGNPLAEALAKHPRQFDDLYCNLVRAGEHAGILESLLDKIATYMEKTEGLKSKIKKAMFYPIAVIVVAFIVTTILMLFVIPQFQDMFSSFGADLPALTLMVIAVSKFFQHYWWLIFGGIGAAIYAFVEVKHRSEKFRHFLDKTVLKLPVFGAILNKAAIARFARTLSTMFAAGVPLVEAMGTVAGASGNIVFSEAILRIRDDISTGAPLNQSMRQTDMFPNMVVQMVAIGEEAGSVDTMLGKVADFYEQEVDDAVDGLSSLLEPIIMAFLGVVIGGLVVAMYLPIFKMGQVV